MRRILLSLLGMLLCSPLFAAETLYVQSLEAKLMQQPKFSAPVVAKLKKGTAVDVVSTDGRWLKVSAADKTGWLSRFLLADHPPLNKVTVLEADKEGLDSDNVRRRASEVTTAGATRGLTADERRRAGEGAANYDALFEMEQLSVSDDEASRFLQEGLSQ